MVEKIKYNTTVIVPIRSGSKGIKNKNIKDFLGLSLFYWTIKKLYHLLKLGKISKIIVSSDSDWYLEMVRLRFYFMTEEELILSKRSDDLATSFSTTEEVCSNELYKYGIHTGVLGIVEVTSPLIPIDSLDMMLDSIDDCVDSSFIVYEDIGQFWKCTKPQFKWEAMYTDRKMRQQEDNSLYREVGAWAIKVDRFLKDKVRIVHPCKPVIIEKKYGLSINTIEEFNQAEILMKEYASQIYSECGLYK